MKLRRLACSITAAAVLVSIPTAIADGQGSDDEDEPPPAEPAVPEFEMPFIAETDEIVHSWTLAPAAVDGGERPQLSYTADPGTVVDDAVTLYNFSNVQLTFRVYAADAFNTETGAVGIRRGDESSDDVGSWVRIPQEYVQLDPGQQVTFPIAVEIPDGARPGDHVGAIVASSLGVGTDGAGAVVGLDRRTGTRLNVRVNGPLTSELAVEGLSTDYGPSANPLGGSATVTYRVENRGNVVVAGTTNVSVSGPFGIAKQSTPPAEIAALLPGQSFTVTEVFDGVPAFGFASTQVRADVDDTGAAAPITASDWTLAPPITVLLLLLAVVLAIVARRAYRRHRSGAWELVVVEDEPKTREPQPT